MKTIIAGSRSIADYRLVKHCIEYSLITVPITEVVCGMARGVDLLGKDWAEENGIPVKEFRPDYERLGRFKAPKARNCDMGDYASFLIGIWDGESTGTIHMWNYMKKLKKHWIFFNTKEKTIQVDKRHPGKGISFL